MRYFFLIVCCISAGLTARAQSFIIEAPGKKLKASVAVENTIKVSLFNDGRPVVQLDDIDLRVHETDAAEIIKVRKSGRRTVNETVVPDIREKASSYPDRFNELHLIFNDKRSITFRLYDEGLAYRFSTSLRDSLYVFRETLKLNFAAGDSAVFQSTPTFNSSYETPYEHRSVSGIIKDKLCSLPFLVEKADGTFIMIAESDLYNYPGLWLKGTGTNTISAVSPPFPETLSYEGNKYNHGQVADAYPYIARAEGTRTYPWRIIAVSDNEKGLVDNNMVYLLASPASPDKFSWVEPGIVMFDWWGKHNIYGVDFKSGINTETAKYYIDFCAAHGMKYFLFDDGWCVGQDLLKPLPELDLPEITRYARSRNVKIMLWILWNSLEQQWDEAFDQFEKWGIQGIKVDFMNRDDQKMVEFYERVAERSAKQQMIVDFHGAYKPCGLRRKYPNVLTREGLIEFEYNGWTNHDNPRHHNLLPYIRMFSGPMDYIPGTMRNSTKDNFRPVWDYPMGQGTRAHSMALAVVLYSPLMMLPDSPSDYYREKECTQFLKDIPVTWDESLLVDGKLGEYTVMARRSDVNWYVGAITGWDKRNLVISTDFLKAGSYELEIISDGINAGARAEDYKRTIMKISAGDKLELSLASGGGWIARFTPVN